MRRHVIIGRLGSSDRAHINTTTGEVVTQLDFIKSGRRLDHGIGQAINDMSEIGLYPSEVGLDLRLGDLQPPPPQKSQAQEGQGGRPDPLLLGAKGRGLRRARVARDRRLRGAEADQGRGT